MFKVYDLRQKEVINIKDGFRFGFISDIEVDDDDGKIGNLIVPGPGRVLGMFGREQEYRIPWNAIKQIGEDLILVSVETNKVLVDCE